MRPQINRERDALCSDGVAGSPHVRKDLVPVVAEGLAAPQSGLQSRVRSNGHHHGVSSPNETQKQYVSCQKSCLLPNSVTPKDPHALQSRTIGGPFRDSYVNRDPEYHPVPQKNDPNREAQVLKKPHARENVDMHFRTKKRVRFTDNVSIVDCQLKPRISETPIQHDLGHSTKDAEIQAANANLKYMDMTRHAEGDEIDGWIRHGDKKPSNCRRDLRMNDFPRNVATHCQINKVYPTVVQKNKQTTRPISDSPSETFSDIHSHSGHPEIGPFDPVPQEVPQCDTGKHPRRYPPIPVRHYPKDCASQTVRGATQNPATDGSWVPSLDAAPTNSKDNPSPARTRRRLTKPRWR